MRIGIIGGSGLYDIEGFTQRKLVRVKTPFGAPSDALVTGKMGGRDVVFLPRHGRGHRILPSELNHRANIWAMKKLGVTHIISVSAVGSLQEQFKPLDIVLLHTGAGKIQDSQAYVTDQVGMTAESTHWMLDQGVKVMGIDAITFDPPVWAMFERQQFWEAHRVMLEREYYHLENMTNLDALPPHGFTLCVLPIKWVNTTAAPVRAVAILED